jgi:hypothetical protein
MEILTNGKMFAGLAGRTGDRVASGTFLACQTAHAPGRGLDASLATLWIRYGKAIFSQLAHQLRYAASE